MGIFGDQEEVSQKQTPYANYDQPKQSVPQQIPDYLPSQIVEPAQVSRAPIDELSKQRELPEKQEIPAQPMKEN